MELASLKGEGSRRNYTYLPVAVEEGALQPEVRDTSDRTAVSKADTTRTIGVLLLVFSAMGLLFLVGTQVLIPSPVSISLADPVDPTLQSPFKQIVHPEPPSPLWGAVTKPYPTGAFWTNFAVGTGDSAVGAYPYGIKALNVGIQVSYGSGRRAVTRTAVTDYFAPDLQISAVQPNAAHSVEKYDKLSVKVGYKTVAGGQYHAHIVKSSPFVTVVYENAAPFISSELIRFLSVEQQVVPGSTGVQYLVTLANYQKWLVYCSEPTPLTVSGNTLSSTSPIKGFIRVAVLPLQNPLAAFMTLMQYVRRYPTGAAVSLQYPNDRLAVVRIDYASVGDGPLLMLALPHHAMLMTTPDQDAEENVRVQTALSPLYCIKGKLLPVVGTVWLLQYNVTQVSWNYAISDKLSTSRLDEVGVSLTSEVRQQPPTAQDPYAFGKQIQRLATLALLADTLGIAEARKAALYTMEEAFTPWLLGANGNALVYDTTYGGVLSTNGIADRTDDFGSGWYNDHHFHYGYLIYAAAVIAKLDAPYFADPAKKAAVESLVRDICNMDEKDPKFPYARHKDFFDGHSWASGIVLQGNGKGQESSSESVNAYYAVQLYATAVGDQELQRFANTLLTMEIFSAQVYWHMGAGGAGSGIYDAVFAASGMVGNIGALDVTASTWFGDNAEFVHGINLMPLTPVTATLFSSAYVQNEFPLLAARLQESAAVERAIASGGGNKAPVTTAGPECSANAVCKQLGMQGMCCPTPESMMLGCCEAVQSGLTAKVMSDEWKALMYADLAVVHREAAWARLHSMSSFGPGNSRANSLYWAATRPPPVPGFNASYARSAQAITQFPSACAANSACDAIGMLGECCPTATGFRLGCCPIDV